MELPTAGEPARKGMVPAHAAALFAVFAAESAAFCAAARHHFTWIYPRWYDQQGYLAEAYGAYERAAHEGFAQGAMQALSRASPQGSLHAFLALLVFEVAGPSRGAALAVNLAAFLALQAATFLAARRISGSSSIAWGAVALLAALQAPWSGGPASAFDFRLDWMAACAFGVALAAGLAGRGFRSTPWAVVFGAAVGAAVLTRFLTAAYFGLILAVLLVWLLLRPGRGARCARLFLSAGVALALCAPALWNARHAIIEYYWIGHFAGPERGLRDSHMGALASVEWLLSGLLLEQAGVAAAVLGVSVAAALLVLGRTRRFCAEPPQRPQGLAGGWVLALAFLGAPAAVLAVQPQKAPQTLGILIPGAVWIVILAWSWLARRARPRAVAAACMAAVLCGAGVFAVALAGGAAPKALEGEYRDVNALGDYLYFRSEEAGLSRPRVAVTWLFDGLRAESFSVVGFERHHRPVQFVATLPTGLFETERGSVMGALAGSDFVCLVTRAAELWPFDRQMAGMMPEMRRWCDANLRRVGSMDEVEFSASIYERSSLGRPSAGAGVDLARMMDAASRGPAYAHARPPAPPLFPVRSIVLGSTRVDFRYTLSAAYSPVSYGAQGLPAGLHLDPARGEIRGRLSRAGAYSARITATNPTGSTVADLGLRIEDEDFFAVLGAPSECRAGAPVEIGYGAFDAGGNLQFVDVTDLTAGRLLGRVEARADQGQRWEGSYRVSFVRPGPRTLLMRFVRLGPGGGGAVSFVDRECTLEVSP